MKQRNSAGLFILVVLALALSPSIANAETIPFVTIDKGEQSCYSFNNSMFSGADMVIRNQKTWAWFWNRHHACRTVKPPLPKVDFLKEMVLVSLLGYQTSGSGPSIKIESAGKLFPDVAPYGIRVTVLENAFPGTSTVITNPFHIVKLPRHASVVFHRRPMYKPCTDNADCGSTEFCEKVIGDCDGNGRCQDRYGWGCIAIIAPVCGCDMVTYADVCQAYAQGVSILHLGACK